MYTFSTVLAHSLFCLYFLERLKDYEEVYEACECVFELFVQHLLKSLDAVINARFWGITRLVRSERHLAHCVKCSLLFSDFSQIRFVPTDFVKILDVVIKTVQRFWRRCGKTDMAKQIGGCEIVGFLRGCTEFFRLLGYYAE
jgi:hypothetical protein